MKGSAAARQRVPVAARAKRSARIHRWRNECGITLVDVVVALVIALFTIIVVSQSFIVIQTIRRSV